ncbi:MAG: hypothetical protein KF819_08890 [Labilithrix sp.]|nr:hypothetical protein [Labilithrix sp.]
MSADDENQKAHRAKFLARALASNVVTEAVRSPSKPDVEEAAPEDGPTLYKPRKEEEEKPPPPAPSSSQRGAPAPPSDFYVPKTQIIAGDVTAAVIAAVDARQRGANAPPAARLSPAPAPTAPEAPQPREMRALGWVLVAIGAMIFAGGLAMFVTMGLP